MVYGYKGGDLIPLYHNPLENYGKAMVAMAVAIY